MTIMTDIHASRTRKVQVMRWAARIVSILWAYFAVFWTWFVFAHFYEDTSLGLAVFIGFFECAVILLVLGAPIVASVWQMEKLGGRLLQIMGTVLFGVILALGIFFVVWEGRIPRLALIMAALLTVVVPPLVSGFLFVGCHRASQVHA